MEPILTIQIPADTRYVSINHAVRQAGVSQAMRRKLRTTGEFLRNGERCTWDTMLIGGDTLAIFLAPAVEREPYAIPLDVCYEDAYMWVINKPAGLLMHPTATERTATLANALAYRCQIQGEVAGFHPVHRLDKDTSGLVIVAKNPMVQHAFTKQRIPILKVYEALCEGRFPHSYVTCRWPIARKEGSIIERCCSSAGKRAHTDMVCLAASEEMSYLRFVLHTGRTHQIRVHMAQLGHPLVGDDIYGGHCHVCERQQLHAKELAFVHPVTGEDVALTAPLPAPFAALVRGIQMKEEVECH